MNNPFEFFDAIFVINLDINLDRWFVFKNEARKMGFLHLVQRIPAIYNEVGGFGCAQSHRKCLEIASKRNLKNVLIFEDDVNFLYEKEYVWDILNKNITKLKNKKWDLFYLGVNIPDSNPWFNNTKDVNIDISDIGTIFGRFAIAINSSAFSVYDNIPNNIINFNPKIHRGDMCLNMNKNIVKLGCCPMLTTVKQYASLTGYLSQKCTLNPIIKEMDLRIMYKYITSGLFNYDEWKKNINITFVANIKIDTASEILQNKDNIVSILKGVDFLNIFVPERNFNNIKDCSEILNNKKIKIIQTSIIDFYKNEQEKFNTDFLILDLDVSQKYSTYFFAKSLNFLINTVI